MRALFLFLLPFVYLVNSSSVTDYAPSANVQCPDLSTTSLIRTFTPQNQTLHPAEYAYISARENSTILAAWRDWLGDGSAIGYNLTSFRGAFPKVGIAIPGGGLRAAQYGASSLLALDARNATAKTAGTGGLLQVTSYITGLSGTSTFRRFFRSTLIVITQRGFLGNWFFGLQRLADYR